ncbi:hypothetical protein [Alicyclobacillus dauci]|uniref:Uncharacterized protein n=1 Tax=Alicyclobacillus dauci TaxID=1475485 RepID=A0ABY6Z322_9BACL|nr:hypothetical protein [Alicyclobacillus dauci]WAH37018.1 hypothetical protein NZD86_00070 [Alicyclobacillus dauci]
MATHRRIVLLAGLILLALIRKILPIPSPEAQDKIEVTPTTMSFPPYPPSVHHLLGTDSQGYDMFSRTLHNLLPTYGILGLTAIATLFCASVLATRSALAHSPIARTVIRILHSWVTIIPTIILALWTFTISYVNMAGLRMPTPGTITWSRVHDIIYLGILALFELGRTAHALQANLEESEAMTYVEASVTSGSNAGARFVMHHFGPYMIQCGEQFISLVSRLFGLICLLAFIGLPLNMTWIHVDRWFPHFTDPTWSATIGEAAQDYFENNNVFPMFAPVLLMALTMTSLSFILSGLRRLDVSILRTRQGTNGHIRLRPMVAGMLSTSVTSWWGRNRTASEDTADEGGDSVTM